MVRPVPPGRPFCLPRRARSAVLLCSLLVGSSVVPARAAPAPAPAAAPATAPATVTPAAGDVVVALEGRGFGHGFGLSQWGAYGYAVDYGWTAAQILGHYYGNTTAGTIAVDSTLAVRLIKLDGAQTAVVSAAGALEVVGVDARTWKSVLAREVSAGTYSVWGRTDAEVCPAASGDPVAGGWTLISPAVATKVDVRPTAAWPGAPADARAYLAAVCEPGGTVRTYRGTIRAINDTNGDNRTVNVLPLEQYLRSVVAKEMSPSWAGAGGGKGVEALKAQAVAARTYAMAENRYVGVGGYARTCDTTACQAYAGVAFRSSVSSGYTQVEYPSTDAAVSATAGVVRRVASGALAYTYYSASSGGHTAPGPSQLSPFPAVVDLGDATAPNPNHTWTASLTGAQISAKYPAIGTFTSLSVTNRNGFGEWGGRATQVRIDGTTGWIGLSGSAFRSAFSLKSDWFNVVGTEPEPDTCEGRTAPDVTGPLPAASAATFNPVTPIRLVDTRDGTGTARLALGAGCTMVVDPLLPASATAATVSVAAVKPLRAGFVTVYPCGTVRPVVSGLLALAGRVVASTSVARLGLDGRLCVYSSVATELVVDLYGWYSTTDGVRYQPVNTTRLFDSRSGARLAAGSVTRVKAVRTGAAPAGSIALAATVHSSDAAKDGFVTVYPCSATRPTVSVVNVAAGRHVTNHAQVSISSGGEVCVYVSSSMHVVLDMSGWFGAAATTRYFAISPYRAVDTRNSIGLSGAFAAGANRAVALAPSPSPIVGLPSAASVRAVFAVVAAVQPSATGFLTVHPCQSPVPSVSMVRYVSPDNAANGVAAIDDASGRWCIFASASTHVVVDVNGYFA